MPSTRLLGDALDMARVLRPWASGSGTVQRVCATRGHVPKATGGAVLLGGGANAYTRFESRMARWIGPDPVTSLRVLFAGHYIGPGQFAQSTCQVECGLEYGGTTTMLTFGGAASATIGGGNPVTSDPLSIAIPANSKIFVRTGVTVPSGSQHVAADPSYAALGEGGVQSTVASSQIAATGVLAIPPGGAAITYNQVTPMALIGTGPAQSAALLFLGDSLCDAEGYDGGGDAQGNQGHYARAAALMPGGAVPYVKHTRTCNTAYAMAAGQKWAILLPYVTHLLCNLGVNDLNQTASGAFTLAAIKTNLQSIWAAARAGGVRVHQGLITTVTSSTDGWATVQNQTATGRFAAGGDRDQLNAWIVSQLAAGAIDGWYDPRPAFCAPGSPNRIVATGQAGVSTTDGIHPTEAWHAGPLTGLMHAHLAQSTGLARRN